MANGNRRVSWEVESWWDLVILAVVLMLAGFLVTVGAMLALFLGGII